MPALQDTRHGASRAPSADRFWDGVMAGRCLGELELLECWVWAPGGLGWPQGAAVFLLSMTSGRAGAWVCLFFSSLFANSFTVIAALLGL